MIRKKNLHLIESFSTTVDVNEGEITKWNVSTTMILAQILTPFMAITKEKKTYLVD